MPSEISILKKIAVLLQRTLKKLRNLKKKIKVCLFGDQVKEKTKIILF